MKKQSYSISSSLRQTAIDPEKSHASRQNSTAINSVDCSNLRLDSPTDTLRPVARPRRLIAGAPLPFYSFIHEGRCIGLFHHESVLFGANLSDERPQLRTICHLPDRVLTAVKVSDTAVEVLTESGFVTLVPDSNGGWTAFADGGGNLPPLTFGTVDEMRLTAAVDPVKLSGDYSQNSRRLTNDDAERLGKQLRKAYNELAATASGSGMLLQPVCLRYRVLDSDGTTLFCSAPILLTAGGDFQCCDKYSVAFNAEFGSLAATAISGTVAQATVNIPSLGGTRAAAIVIEAGDPIHPFDFGLMPETAVSVSGNDLLCTFYMPGAAVTMAPANESRRQLLEAVSSIGDDAFRPIAEFSSADTGVKTLFIPACGTVDRQIASVKFLTTRSQKTEAGVTYTAGAAAATARCLVTGNLKIGRRSLPSFIMAVARERRYEATEPVDCNVGTVVGIREMHRRDSNLDPSRTRLYVFGTEGIAVATLSADGRVTAVNIIDRRGVGSPQQIAETGFGDYQMAVVAGGELLMLNRSKAYAPGRRASKLSAVAADASRRELWMLSYDGTLSIVDGSLRYISRITSIEADSLCTTADGRVLLHGDGDIFIPVDRMDYNAELPYCELTVEFEAPRAAGRPLRPLRLDTLALEITGEGEGSLVIHASNVPWNDFENGNPVAGFELLGSFNAPLILPIACPYRRYFRVRLRLIADDDLALGRLEAVFS